VNHQHHDSSRTTSYHAPVPPFETRRECAYLVKKAGRWVRRILHMFQMVHIRNSPSRVVQVSSIWLSNSRSQIVLLLVGKRKSLRVDNVVTILGAACMVLTRHVLAGLVAHVCVLLPPFASSCERRPLHVSPNKTYRSYRSGVERVLRIVTGQLA